MDTQARKVQIGVMGSSADLNYLKDIEVIAEEIGYLLAQKGVVTFFGAEKDYDSLSTAAARGAKRGGGITVGVTYGKGLTVFEKNLDIVIASGLERGGGREFALVLSCDAIILIGGGSGTLTEAAIAYQANVPIIAVAGTGGWADKLAGTYLDERKRLKVVSVKTPVEAVEMAWVLAQQKYAAS